MAVRSGEARAAACVSEGVGPEVGDTVAAAAVPVAGYTAAEVLHLDREGCMCGDPGQQEDIGRHENGILEG